MKKIIAALLLTTGFLQAQSFTHRDSLMGGNPIERSCFDVLHYGLDIKIDVDKRYISGKNEIVFKGIEKSKTIQIDLFENMVVDSIVFENKKLNYKRDEVAVFITFNEEIQPDKQYTLNFYYSGFPKVAKNAPWDGGFVFSKDSNNKPFVGVAVQGTGASLWYPVKDTQRDEPDFGATIKVAVPNELTNVSNGRFKGSTDLKNGYTRWDWEVVNPINTYDITINIADYVHFTDKLDNLDIDYYVLRENEEKAKEHFKEVKPMLACFQEKFGEYPFIEDGYKLVETSYLGMEHQSAIAYGNKYKKGYMGYDYNGSGTGMFFDYITIHESAHEWFGNSITSADIADMWIHEGFTTYAEAVFVECQKGYETALKYVNANKQRVSNRKNIAGHYNVNNEPDGEMYSKGALFVNTLRHILDDEEKWSKILYDYSTTFKKKIVTTQQVEAYFSKAFEMDLSAVFNHYIYEKRIPNLVLDLKNNKLTYHFDNVTDDFTMPIYIFVKDKKVKLNSSNKEQTIKLETKNKQDIKMAYNQFLISY